MEWDWPEENLRRPQLDKFSARRCDTDLGAFDAEQNSSCTHTLPHAHRAMPAEKKKKKEKKGKARRRDLAVIG